jgi:hypothetical protein
MEWGFSSYRDSLVFRSLLYASARVRVRLPYYREDRRELGRDFLAGAHQGTLVGFPQRIRKPNIVQYEIPPTGLPVERVAKSSGMHFIAREFERTVLMVCYTTRA